MMFLPSSNQSKSGVFIYDVWVLLSTFFLLVVGLLMVASASMVISDQQYGSPFHFLLHELAYVILGIMLIFFVIRIPIAFWRNNGIFLLLGTFLLLILVLVPGLGRNINGSTRWLGCKGFVFEVSELAKFAVIVYLAGYLMRHEEEVQKKFSGFLKPMLILALIAGLLLLEPDFGAASVIMLTALAMLFLAGARLWQFLLLVAVVAGAFGFLAVTSPYRLARLTSFLNPWEKPFDTGYQLTQSLIAFGRGGIFGTGLGNSMQKLFYLPEAHTDFLFAVLAEEFGIIGQTVVMGLFAALVGRALYIGHLMQRLGESFAAQLAYGFGLCFCLQALINIGVNTGILPTKGLALPFISYGGSSMLINCAMIAILLRIYHEVSLQKTNALRVINSEKPQN